jgi:hypothetical protein
MTVYLDTFPSPGDYYMAVGRNLVQGQSSVVILGHNPSQTAASGFVDISEFGDITYLTSAETMNMVSTSTDDDVAGTGALTVLVSGVDGTGAAISEVVIMTGQVNKLTSNSYLRVNQILLLTAGTGTVNAGAITATASTAATVQAKMGIGDGVSHDARYTVPLGSTLYVLKGELNAHKVGGGQSPSVIFDGLLRPTGASRAFIKLFDKTLDTDVTNELDVELSVPDGSAVSRSDIKFQADTTIDATETRIRLYCILIEDQTAP